MNYQKFLPFENFIIETTLSGDKLIGELSNNIEVPRTWSWTRKSKKPFEGTLRDNEFTIQRVIDYRNSFLPELRGKILESGGTVRISVNMSVASIVKAFMVVWLGALDSRH